MPFLALFFCLVALVGCAAPYSPPRIVAAATVAPAWPNAHPLPDLSQVRTVAFTGTSMLPLLLPGSTLQVDMSPAAFDRIVPGSFALAYPSARAKERGKSWCHQVCWRVSPGAWQARGTNLLTNPKPDPSYITRDNFVGLVVHVAPPPLPSGERGAHHAH